MTCQGMSDDCLGEATTTRETSDGWLPAEHFCAACAADFDRRMDNYDPPDPDGEAFRGGEARAYQTEQMAQWRRVK